MDPLTQVNTRATPQFQPADPRQVPNSGGGYAFVLDDMARLRRFITIGVQGGTFYAGERELTRDNADVVLRLARERGADVVAEVLAISTAGRAPKQQPGLFALAAVAGLGDVDARRAALAALPMVARTGSTLFAFAKYVEQFRGWGRALRRGIAAWYLDQEVEALAYQLAKYRQRDGWTHRDLLRLAHPEPAQIVNEAGDRVDVDMDAPMRRCLFDFACGRAYAVAPRILEAFVDAGWSDSPAKTARLVRENRGLSWEMLQPEHLNDPEVWSALLDNGMPQTALMRQLPRLTRLGLLAPGGAHTQPVAAQLAGRMAAARVHPMNVLVALRTYASGRSIQGTSTWTPAPQIVDALDAGFYEAFGGVEPTGKRTMLAIDVSASMTWHRIAGLPITPREASAAMAMVTAATEPHWQALGFAHQLVPVDISPRRRLDDAIAAIERLPWGATDCALPMVHALREGLEVDTFIVYTDGETNVGPIHPHQALVQYRERTGIPARLVVCAMTSTGFSLADDRDPGMLDIAGLDSAVPQFISDFSAGRI